MIRPIWISSRILDTTSLITCYDKSNNDSEWKKTLKPFPYYNIILFTVSGLIRFLLNSDNKVPHSSIESHVSHLCRFSEHGIVAWRTTDWFAPNGSFTLHGTGNGNGTRNANYGLPYITARFTLHWDKDRNLTQCLLLCQFRAMWTSHNS